MNLTLSAEPGLYIAKSSPGMRDHPNTALIPQDLWAEVDQTNASFLTRAANLSSYPNSTLTPPVDGHPVWLVIIIVLLTGTLSLVTIIGNILVLVSFKLNKQLKTVNNYYLLSLAFADLIIGVLSMNLYTTYIIMKKWALGNWACDLWLAIDYVASNASVMNLLVISFDRYFSVTRPLTYRVKRTTKRAMIMIGLAWAISFVLWAPAILFWQYFVGKRTVPPDDCYIQFLSEPITTFCTAIAAFYLPVTIMTVLYWRIYKETENRSKELADLKCSGNKAKQDSKEESAAITSPTDGSQNKPKKANLLQCWPLGRGAQKHRTTGDPEHSSSDSWNNNDGGISIDDDEEDGEMSAIYSIVADANQDIECMDVEKTSKLATQSMAKVENSKPGCSTSRSSSALLSSKDNTKQFDSKAKVKGKKVSLVREKKAAQTLSAILLAFIITWTPYNIMVLVNTFCNDCIDKKIWALGYWLCYVNSTVNPMCYALCNKNFRTTFRMILLCQWGKQNQNKPQLQQRNPAVAYRKKDLV